MGTTHNTHTTSESTTKQQMKKSILLSVLACLQLTGANPQNVALGKTVTVAQGQSAAGAGSLVVDGSTDTTNIPTWTIGSCSFSQFVTIDLGSQFNINQVRVWQYFGDSRQYCGQKLALSKTGLFIGEEDYTWNTGASYGPTETAEGKLVAQNPGSYRYVRYYTSQSNKGDNLAQVSEISVLGTPSDPTNFALGKPVTLSSGVQGSASSFVDGLTTPSLWATAPHADATTCDQVVWATVDLGRAVDITEVRVWQYYGDTRRYCNKQLELSLSGAFAGEQVSTWNAGPSYSTTPETSAGSVLATNAGVFRYVRFYSSRSTSNTGIHLAEIFVLGFEAPTPNLARGASVQLSYGSVGTPSNLVDGDINPSEWAEDPNWNVDSCHTQAYATIDLGQFVTIDTIRVWQYYGDVRQYCGQLLELSQTGLFIGEQVSTWNTGPSNGPYATADGLIAARQPAGAFRYVRFYSSQSTQNIGVHLLEIAVYGFPAPPTNLALGKSVTLSPLASGSSTALVDGVTTPSLWPSAPNWSGVATCDQVRWATIDLGAPTTITEIRVWQYYGDARHYCNQKLDLSLSGFFGGEETTTWNTGASYSDYAEQASGNVVARNPEGVFRYVRYYSSRSNVNTGVHLAEIAVYGYPAGSPNLARQGTVTFSAPTSYSEVDPHTAVDGVTDPSVWAISPNWDVDSCDRTQFLTVDLGTPANIESVRVWQYYGDVRHYCGQLLELSLTGEFNGEQVQPWNTGPSYGPVETDLGNIVARNPAGGPFRFVRYHSSRSNLNTGIHIGEIAVYGTPVAPPNAAFGQAVTLSSPSINQGLAANLVDGNTLPADWRTQPNWNANTCDRTEWAQVDLGHLVDIQQVVVWQYYGDARSYCSQLLELSVSGKFNGEQVQAWNTGPSYAALPETSAGNIVARNAGAFRYVRYHSSRSTANTGVHIAELAVYGFPAATQQVTGSSSYFAMLMTSSPLVGAAVAVFVVVGGVLGVVVRRRRQAHIPLLEVQVERSV